MVFYLNTTRQLWQPVMDWPLFKCAYWYRIIIFNHNNIIISLKDKLLYSLNLKLKLVQLASPCFPDSLVLIRPTIYIFVVKELKFIILGIHTVFCLSIYISFFLLSKPLGVRYSRRTGTAFAKYVKLLSVLSGEEQIIKGYIYESFQNHEEEKKKRKKAFRRENIIPMGF